MIKPQVLVVEDEAIVAEDIRRTLENLGYAVPSIASSGEKAIQIIEKHNPDLILMDVVLQGKMDGVETAKQISSLFNIPVIYLTAYSDKTTIERAKITDPFGYIIKPFREKELKMAIEIALFKHETQEHLKESKEWLSTTLKSISDAVVATDPEGCVKFMNPVAQSLTGWSLKEAQKMPLKDVFHVIYENTGEPVEDFVTEMDCKGAFSKENQTALIAKNKTKIPLDICSASIKDERGSIIGTVMVFRDITERKKTEDALKESEERYRRLVDFSPFGISVYSDHRIVYINLAGAKILGAVKPEELIGKNIFQIIHPEYHELVKERIRRQEQGEVAPLIEEKFQRLDGAPVDVEITSIPFIYKGKTGIYGVFQDITERKRAEEALRLKEERFRLLIENASDVITILNVDGTISYESPSVERVLGYRPEELIGRTLYEYVHPDNLADVTNTINNLVQNPGAARSAEFHCMHKDGSWRIIEFVGKSILNDTGANELIINSRDITNRKLAEERLKEANIELIRANKLKTQFLSVVSHELRTPITPMNAQLQMILAGFFGETTEKQKNSLDMILRNTKRLDRLIGDVLDISKLESGVMKFNTAKACLNEIVENAVETMRIQALDKNQELTIKEDKIPEITVDKDRITQVVVNLLNNAIKFTDAGGKIEVELSGNADHARVEVRDNGIGIKKEDQERLFTPFQQVDSSESRKYEGSGLGLAICKKIVTYHGGSIGIDSKTGRGSTFYFTIPYDYRIKEEKVDSSLFEKIMQNEA